MKNLTSLRRLEYKLVSNLACEKERKCEKVKESKAEHLLRGKRIRNCKLKPKTSFACCAIIIS